MAMFGRRYTPLEMTEIPVEGVGDIPAGLGQPIKGVAPAPQQGMFGRARGLVKQVRGSMSPDRWQMLSAGLHDLSRGTNTLPDVQQMQLENQRQQAEDAWRARQQERQTMEWGQEDDQRKQVDAFIAQLPPEEQAAARLNPKAYIEALMKQGGGEREYQNFGSYDPATGVWTEIPGAVEAYRRAHPQQPNGSAGGGWSLID